MTVISTPPAFPSRMVTVRRAETVTVWPGPNVRGANARVPSSVAVTQHRPVIFMTTSMRWPAGGTGADRRSMGRDGPAAATAAAPVCTALVAGGVVTLVGPVPVVPSRDTASVITAAADSPAITRPGHRRCGTTTVVGTATRCGSGSSLRDVKASTRGSGSSPT